jgi:hypothetical protein
MLRSNLLAGLLSWVLESVVLPVQVNLFLRRDDSVGQLVGGHAESSQTTLFQVINLVSQGHDIGEFKRSRFFIPRPLKLRESAYERMEVGFMVLAV